MVLTSTALVLLVAVVSRFLPVVPVHGFPPAPYYTLYGMVRDQVGQVIRAEGTQLILLKDGVEVARTPIHSSLRLDQNYELNVRVDQNRSGTKLYSEKALPAEGLFSLEVEMNGSRYLPIEAAGNLTAGRGSERVRLDLNLGEDSDGDGLPDIWEQWQLYQAGYQADAGGQWPIGLLDRDGDFDRDGQSNWREYLAGTFAGDATERFDLEIKEKAEDGIRFEFYAVTGKTYTLETSTDGETWKRMSFALGTEQAGPFTRVREEVHRAESSGILSAFAPPAENDRELYRLTVR